MSALLISVEDLLKQLAGTANAVLLVDCRAKLQAPDWGREQYLAGHLPGAVFADLEQDLSGPIIAGKTGRHPLPAPAALARFFGQIGIGPQTQVVAYDDAGGVYASHLWWLLRWLGHDQCALLNGGLPAWIAAGQPLQQGDFTVSPQPFIGELQAGLTVQAEVLLLEDPQRVLFDVRGAARYAGKEERIDPIAGHIPSAINLPFAGNLDSDGSFLPVAQLRTRYANIGANGVAYCGSGVSACHSIFSMAVAGLPPAKLYPGSWSEWITDPSRPVARGME